MAHATTATTSEHGEAVLRRTQTSSAMPDRRLLPRPQDDEEVALTCIARPMPASEDADVDRKASAAFVAMAVASLTFVVDGAVTLSGSSGDQYQAYRIVVNGGGRGMNHFVGRGEVIFGVVIALLSLGLLLNRSWGWVAAVLVGLIGLAGFSDAAAADRVVGACAVVILLLALIHRHETRRLSASESHL